MKMKGLMKKILLLLAVVLSFGTVMAAEYIRFDMSAGDAVGVPSFNKVRIVPSETGGTTHNKIVFGAGKSVATVAANDGRYKWLSLSIDDVAAIKAAMGENAYFYFEFYNNNDIVGYSDYVTADALGKSLSSFIGSNGTHRGDTLQVTGYAAPEPTSGLLLLVGGALLGLRRKRRVA